MRHLLIDEFFLKKRLIYLLFVAVVVLAVYWCLCYRCCALLLCVLSASNKTSYSFTHFTQIKQISLHHTYIDLNLRNQLLFFRQQIIHFDFHELLDLQNFDDFFNVIVGFVFLSFGSNFMKKYSLSA